MGSDTQLSKTSSDTSSTATAEGTMQAVVQDTYGSADMLRLARIARPEIGDDKLLLRVHAASVHIGDWHVMTGLPYRLRVVGFGFRAPKSRDATSRGQRYAVILDKARNPSSGRRFEPH
jgi:hypothetical protein